MLSHFAKRFQVLAFVGFGAALTGCTAVPEVTEDVVSAEGTVVASNGVAVPAHVSDASTSTTFEYDDPSSIYVTLSVPTPDGRAVTVDISAHLAPGNMKSVDLTSVGAEVCVCTAQDTSPMSLCLDTPVCAPAHGTLTGSYDNADVKDNYRLYQFDGTFTLDDPAGYTGTIHFVHKEDWTYESSSSGGNNSFWNTNWNG